MSPRSSPLLPKPRGQAVVRCLTVCLEVALIRNGSASQIPGGWGAQAHVRRNSPAGGRARGENMGEGLVCFPQDKRGEVGRAGVGSASLNGFRGHRGTGAAPGDLVSGPGVIGAGEPGWRVRSSGGGGGPPSGWAGPRERCSHREVSSCPFRRPGPRRPREAPSC